MTVFFVPATTIKTETNSTIDFFNMLVVFCCCAKFKKRNQKQKKQLQFVFGKKNCRAFKFYTPHGVMNKQKEIPLKSYNFPFSFLGGKHLIILPLWHFDSIFLFNYILYFNYVIQAPVCFYHFYFYSSFLTKVFKWVTYMNEKKITFKMFTKESINY